MIVDRIRQIIAYEKISTRQFCLKVGVANGFLDKVKDVGSEKLAKILYAFPDISPEWLLTGKGEMLRQAEEKEGYRPSQASDATVNKLIEEIKHLSSHIGRLETENERLSHELREKQGTHTRINVAKSKLTHNP